MFSVCVACDKPFDGSREPQSDQKTKEREMAYEVGSLLGRRLGSRVLSPL